MSVITELSNVYLSMLETVSTELATARDRIGNLERMVTDRDTQIVYLREDVIKAQNKGIEWYPKSEKPERWPVLVEYRDVCEDRSIDVFDGEMPPLVIRWCYIPEVSK